MAGHQRRTISRLPGDQPDRTVARAGVHRRLRARHGTNVRHLTIVALTNDDGALRDHHPLPDDDQADHPAAVYPSPEVPGHAQLTVLRDHHWVALVDEDPERAADNQAAGPRRPGTGVSGTADRVETWVRGGNRQLVVHHQPDENVPATGTAAVRATGSAPARVDPVKDLAVDPAKGPAAGPDLDHRVDGVKVQPAHRRAARADHHDVVPMDHRGPRG